MTTTATALPIIRRLLALSKRGIPRSVLRAAIAATTATAIGAVVLLAGVVVVLALVLTAWVMTAYFGIPSWASPLTALLLGIWAVVFVVKYFE